MRPQNGLRAGVASALTSAFVRPIANAIPANRAGVAFSRAFIASGLWLASPPLKGSRIEPGIRGEWVRAPDVSEGNAVVLYIHGSGYALCSARTHRGLTTRVSAGTGLPVFACEYRLAPRHRFPSAADDVRAAYDRLLGQGYRRILVAGDSAGGHLAVDLAAQLIRERKDPPAALALFSPLFDVTFSLAAQRERMSPDPMISAAAAARLVGLYTVDADLASARLRFAFDDIKGFPPTIIQAGGLEMLAADAIELARALRRAGADCELDVVPGQMHVFQALTRFIPEAAPAMERACRFLTGNLPAIVRAA
ncbi:alpha/beta hydrolase [Amycolatopsis sp. EV170708-02-1]|uniref:alpha/beta hydrolase n=1 Tax=Amycolatopsis sp. EV170708-02-1 TaxID=2919322 RepID=UPI001F0B94A1|nr:alpha/beta hydrolase [Amycolatopsis sp. EV170708-02-1]UMP05459.1 alpha/beta hydrolase [Amycolatopsis sp. EV170708-02-1]